MSHINKFLKDDDIEHFIDMDSEDEEIFDNEKKYDSTEDREFENATVMSESESESDDESVTVNSENEAVNSKNKVVNSNISLLVC